MKRNNIALICAALLLTACGTGSGNTPQTQAETTQAAQTVTTAAEETATVTEKEEETSQTAAEETTVSEETTTAAAEEEKQEEPPAYTLEKTDEDKITAEDNEAAVLFKGEYYKLVITNKDKYPKLADKIEQIMKIRHDTYEYSRQSMTESGQELYSYSPESFTDEWPMSCYANVTNNVSRCDSTVFSFMNTEDGYGGGAHGWYTKTSANIDSQTGEDITLSDLCTDIPKLVDVLAEKLEKEYSEAVELEWNNVSSYREVLTNAYGEDLLGYDKTYEDGDVYHLSGMYFVFVPDGVMFFTNNYDIAPYAAGTQELTVLFSEHEDLFNKKYATVGDDFLIREPQLAMFVDIDGNGEGEKVEVETTYDNEAWKVTAFTLKAGDKEYPIDYDSSREDYWNWTGELERKDGKYIYRMYDPDGALVTEQALN